MYADDFEDRPSYAAEPPKLLGGAPGVDFVNTVSWRGRTFPEGRDDRLTSYAELIHWCGHAGLLRPKARKALLELAEQEPKAAAKVLADAVEFRELAARLLLGNPQRTDKDDLNALLVRAPERVTLVQGTEGWGWSAESKKPLERPLWLLVWNLADLLTAGEQARVCGDPECGWLFLDHSRSNKRRWCSMDDCGNRAKSRRHYAKQTDA